MSEMFNFNLDNNSNYSNKYKFSPAKPRVISKNEYKPELYIKKNFWNEVKNTFKNPNNRIKRFKSLDEIKEDVKRDYERLTKDDQKSKIINSIDNQYESIDNLDLNNNHNLVNRYSGLSKLKQYNEKIILNLEIPQIHFRKSLYKSQSSLDECVELKRQKSPRMLQVYEKELYSGDLDGWKTKTDLNNRYKNRNFNRIKYPLKNYIDLNKNIINRTSSPQPELCIKSYPKNLDNHIYDFYKRNDYSRSKVSNYSAKQIDNVKSDKDELIITKVKEKDNYTKENILENKFNMNDILFSGSVNPGCTQEGFEI